MVVVWEERLGLWVRGRGVNAARHFLELGARAGHVWQGSFVTAWHAPLLPHWHRRAIHTVTADLAS